MKLIWSPRAAQRLEGIADYIARDSEGAAANFVASLLEATEKLVDYPRIGRVVPEFGYENVREIFHKNYRIIYEVKSDAVELLTIRHGKQLLKPTDYPDNL